MAPPERERVLALAAVFQALAEVRGLAEQGRNDPDRSRTCLSGLLGRIYGQVPEALPTVVAVLALVMGLNLLGLVRLPLPAGPDPQHWSQHVPAPLAPIAAGLAFGLAASPCTTPVLAVLLGWIATSGSPLIGVVLLTSFGFGQVMPLLLAGSAAASVPGLLAPRPIGRWVPPISGMVLIATGALPLFSHWI